MGVVILEFGLRILDFLGIKTFSKNRNSISLSIFNSQYSIQERPTFLERSTHPTLNAKQHQENTSTFDIPCSIFGFFPPVSWIGLYSLCSAKTYGTWTVYEKGEFLLDL
jgi:hypothetical protein